MMLKPAVLLAALAALSVALPADIARGKLFAMYTCEGLIHV